MDLSELMTDPKAEVEGVWCPLGNGARIKVARVNNDQYTKELRRKFKSNKAVLEQDDDFANEKSEEIMIEVFAKTILKDVEGITINGKDIGKYSPETGITLLRVKDFREKVKHYADNFDIFKKKEDEEAKND